MLSGQRPFPGGSIEDLREAHLHADPPPLEGVPTALATLVDECLYKAPQTRPSPANFRARLERHQAKIELSAGLAQLQEADHVEVQRRAESARQQSRARTESERRSDLASSAARAFARIADQLSADITASAPSRSVEVAQWGMGASPAHRDADPQRSFGRTRYIPGWVGIATVRRRRGGDSQPQGAGRPFGV
jgi:serine/threonine-protein kinase